jgi:hypothetical protein
LDKVQKRCEVWRLKGNRALSVLRCRSVIGEEGAIVRDCRGIEKIGVMHKVGIIDHSVNGECEGGRDSGVGKVQGGDKGKQKKGENRRKEKKKVRRRERKVGQERAKPH